MSFAAWNTNAYLTEKKNQLDIQIELVEQNDQALSSQIDSLNQGLATYEKEYTLPTSGVRLTYNNHRLACMPISAFNLIAIGQGDLFSNYKKIVLYFNDSYERSSHELISPIEQLFGQLDLAFVWAYLLPLFILLITFNILSIERETGRLKLIASQPIKISNWLFAKIHIRFFTIFLLLIIFTLILLSLFGVSIAGNFIKLSQLIIILFLYTAFWFFLSFRVNLLGYTSGKNLILLANIWVLFVFLIPSVVNQLGKELHTIPSRLEIINHHQATYNEVEKNLEQEIEALFHLHPDWSSNDPVTKDLSNSTGWNINYLAKQYLAQLKHQPKAQAYEAIIDGRNQWVKTLRVLSPTMIFQNALTDLAGTSTRYYRSFLQEAQQYAHEYRQYIFKGLFTNHAFTSKEIKSLPKFEFDSQDIPRNFWEEILGLIFYLAFVRMASLALPKANSIIH